MSHFHFNHPPVLLDPTSAKMYWAALDAFNAKYPSIKGAITQAPPGLSFTGPRLEQAVPSAVVMAVPTPVAEDPMEKLEKLKAMMDKGLITEAEYDAKKAQILSDM